MPKRLCLFLLMSVLCLAPLRAQTDPPPDVPEDPGTSVDPGLSYDNSTLSDPDEAYVGSPLFAGSPSEGDELGVMPPGGGGGDETAGTGAPNPGWPPVNCSNFPGIAAPVFTVSGSERFFLVENKPVVLIGASADAGCALNLAETDQCRITNYPQAFTMGENRAGEPPTDLPALALNKTRVWVSMGYGYSDPYRISNSAFRWETTPAPAHWRVDLPGEALTSPLALKPFFDRLKDIVNEARRHKLIVEVTFFAPFEGKQFSLGPWSTVFATDYAEVTKAPSSPMTDVNQAQVNIISWTVEALWCFDNVTWEIANEPEGQGSDKRSVDPTYVAAWQNAMIFQVRKAERVHTTHLSRGHLIAVQPFSVIGATTVTQPPNPPAEWSAWPLSDRLKFPLGPQILNAHYIAVNLGVAHSYPNGSLVTLDMGAFGMLQRFKKAMPYGFNENKISSVGASDRTTKTYTNGTGTPQTKWGEPEPVRAEAWEFIFSGGTSYDNYSYLGSRAATVRLQLGRLLDFINHQGFGILRTNGTPAWPTDFRPASMANWLTAAQRNNPSFKYRAWDAPTQSERRWAALESASSAAPQALLFYLHHSTGRCKPDSVPYSAGCGADPTNSGNYLSFDGYAARIWTQSPNGDPAPAYQETLQFSGGSNLNVSWIDPETLGKPGFPQSPPDTIRVACTAGCTLSSPRYKFDILLRVVRVP